LAFFPFGNRYFRTGTALVFIGFHMGLALSFDLGIFPFVCSIAWFLLFPEWLGDRFGAVANKIGQQPWFCRIRDFLERWDMSETAPPSLPVIAAKDSLRRRLRAWGFYGLTTLALVLSLWSNLNQVAPEQVKFPEPVSYATEVLGVEQFWRLFAPYPMQDDGWYVIPALRVNGEEIDLFRDGAPVRWEKPYNVSAEYKSSLWRKYMMSLWSADHSEYRLPFAQYLCRLWNHGEYDERDPKAIRSFRIVYMLENSPPPGQPVPKAIPTTIWEHSCFEDAPGTPDVDSEVYRDEDGPSGEDNGE
jgi:hypothetical protein